MTRRKQTTTGHPVFGSVEHATLLGLRKAVEQDTIKWKGWAWIDLSQFGFTFRDDVVLNVLQQQVNVLTTKPVPYPEPMWSPDLERKRDKALRGG